MRRPIKTRKDLDISSDHFLRRNPGYPLGVTLTELDYLRGWTDDFQGDAYCAEYTIAVNGAGSSAGLVGAAHGGWFGLTAGPGAGRYAQLWLGDTVDGFPTLDADEGWVMITRMRLSTTANIAGYFGVSDAASNNLIWGGLNTSWVAASWSILTRTGGGGINAVNTGVAADTQFHWHVLWAYPITGGRRVDYFVDGALIGTTTISMPTVLLTPIVVCYTPAAVLKNLDLDYWGVIPRNL